MSRLIYYADVSQMNGDRKTAIACINAIYKLEDGEESYAIRLLTHLYEADVIEELQDHRAA